jgi:hypothetical protein
MYHFSFTPLFEHNECVRLSGTAVREMINDIIYKVGHPTSQNCNIYVCVCVLYTYTHMCITDKLNTCMATAQYQHKNRPR